MDDLKIEIEIEEPERKVTASDSVIVEEVALPIVLQRLMNCSMLLLLQID